MEAGIRLKKGAGLGGPGPGNCLLGRTSIALGQVYAPVHTSVNAKGWLALSVPTDDLRAAAWMLAGDTSPAKGAQY